MSGQSILLMDSQVKSKKALFVYCLLQSLSCFRNLVSLYPHFVCVCFSVDKIRLPQYVILSCNQRFHLYLAAFACIYDIVYVVVLCSPDGWSGSLGRHKREDHPSSSSTSVPLEMANICQFRLHDETQEEGRERDHVQTHTPNSLILTPVSTEPCPLLQPCILYCFALLSIETTCC